MADNPRYRSSDAAAPKGPVSDIMNGEVGTHPIIQETKADFKGLAGSGQADGDYDDAHQPTSHFHSLFYDLFTWKFPKATGFFFFTTISLIFAFRYVNVLRYVFKATYMLFAIVAGLEIVGKPLGAKGVVSSLRPKRYYTIPRESVERFFEQIHDLANFFVLEFQRVLFVENIFTTIAAFVTSFFGYFLIKYIPFWALLLLTTVTAFTAPLIYINNKELIDEQLHRASKIVNAQLESTKKLTGKYAEDAAARARATAADLQTKVQGYTGGAHKSPSTATAHDSLNNGHISATTFNYPKTPTNDPASNEPLLA